MKNQLLKSLIWGYMLFALPMTAQEPELKYCGSSERYHELAKEHPEILIQEEAFRNWTANYIQTHKQTRGSSSPYIIPIVFHVIHDYGTENISDAQVIDEVRILNEDYNKLNPDTGAVVPSFKSLVANMQITFELAKLDPQGNCTNGIEHIASFETYVGTDESKLNQWNRDSYLNVWVVKLMAHGVAGYAYFPSATVGLLDRADGVIILSSYIGSIGSSSPMTSRALTHEIGHFFSLEHPWGNTNSPGVACGDDGVSDTPYTKGWTTCVLNGCVCDTANHVIENVQNYMEYSYCSKMFTLGQKNLVMAALNSNVSFRNNLWDPVSLASTGVLNAPATCSPHTDFHANKYFICLGGTVLFMDNSWGAPVTNRTWHFQDGTPSTSATQSVTYSTWGWKSVSLTCSNSAGADSVLRNTYVYVSAGYPDYSGLHSEDFENQQEVQTNWISVNHFNFGRTWSAAGNCGHSGSHCMLMDNYNNTLGATDDLISPAYDLSLVSNASLTFWYSEASRSVDTASMHDVLKVYASIDCGQTWILRSTIKNSALYNAGLFSAPYLANNPSLWTQASVALPSGFLAPNVRFKFELTSGGTGLSNNLYIDDVNINGVLGINESTVSGYQISLQPNPSSGDMVLNYSLFQNETISISLTDLIGKEMTLLKNQIQIPGEHQLQINREALGIAPGMYLISITNGSHKSTAKLIFTK
jgi:PKD repeat protein